METRIARDTVDADRKVLDASITDGVATLVMCDVVYQNRMTLEMTAQIRAVLPTIKKDARVIILASSWRAVYASLSTGPFGAGRPSKTRLLVRIISACV